MESENIQREDIVKNKPPTKRPPISNLYSRGELSLVNPTDKDLVALGWRPSTE